MKITCDFRRPGNPFSKPPTPEVEFSPIRHEEVLREEVSIQRQPDPGHSQAGGDWHSCPRPVPGARHQHSHVLQVALEVRRHGRVAHGPLKELQEENRRLKKMYAEEWLKPEIMQEALAKKW